MYGASRRTHGDQCQEDQADDKQHQWHQDRDQSKWTEVLDESNLEYVADDIDGLAGGEELEKIVERLDKASTAYSTEKNAEKAMLMTNNTSDINTENKLAEA